LPSKGSFCVVEELSTADFEQLQLLRRAKKHKDPSAINALIQAHTPLVKSIAARFINSGEPFEDLVQEGVLGLLSAIELFDESHGIKFATYAHHLITGQIRHYLRDRGTLIRQPAWVQELRSKLERCRAELAEELGREPTISEIAQRSRLKEQRVQEILALGRSSHVLRLDEATDEVERPAVELERTKVASQASLSVEDRIAVDQAISKLRPVEQKVIRGFFFHDMTQTEIARKLGVSCNYVSRVLKTGLSRLQEILAVSGVVVPSDRLQAKMMEVEPDSVLDPVTGLYNRRYFAERLEEELIRAQRYGHSVALLRIEVEPVPEGDDGLALLRDVGEFIKKNVRRVDITCRFGEREFAVIMPHTSFGAVSAGKRIAAGMAASENQALRLLCVRAGLAVFPDQAISASHLVELAAPKEMNE